MEGVITIKDSRENLNQMQEWRRKEASKIIKNQKTENTIDTVVDVTKSVVSFAGTVATIAMTICPLDGPAGELAVMAATPTLVQAVESSRNLLKGIFVNRDFKQIQAAMSDIQSNVKNITIPDRNMAQTVRQNSFENVDMVK